MFGDAFRILENLENRDVYWKILILNNIAVLEIIPVLHGGRMGRDLCVCWVLKSVSRRLAGDLLTTLARSSSDG